MEDAMLGEEDTVLDNEDTSIESGEDPALVSAGGSVLLGEESSALIREDAAVGKGGAVRQEAARGSAGGAAPGTPGSKGKLLIVIPPFHQGPRRGAVLGDGRHPLPPAD